MDGIRHAKSTGTGNVRQARIIEDRFKDELNLKRRGLRQPEPDMPFGELAARFLAEGSQKPYHVDRLKVLLPFFADIPIGRIHKGTAREYRRYRHSQKSVSETTVNRDLEALRHFLFWAVDEGFLTSNPLSHPPLVRERRKPRHVLGLAEEELLLAAAAPHLQQIIIAALETGMRRGEILSQRWEHVDLSRGLLQVTRSKTVEGEAREIPLTNRLQNLLIPRFEPEGLVFTFKGHPIRAIKTAWKAAIFRAGIRYYRFHDLRHTFNTRLMEAGVIQDIRKAIMGHSSGEDVHSIYTHVELPAKREAIRKLEEWRLKQYVEMKTKGGSHDSTESGRIFGQTRSGTAEAVEKENPGRSGARPN
jgi:integrase